MPLSLSVIVAELTVASVRDMEAWNCIAEYIGGKKEKKIARSDTINQS